jgi:beta-glucosidase-like glycosyl hydrolase
MLGSILVPGHETPTGDGGVCGDRLNHAAFLNATLENWQDMSRRLNISTQITDEEFGAKYNIYPLLGTDAVHGNQHVVGTTLFPHNIGLSCTHNPQNFFNAGNMT